MAGAARPEPKDQWGQHLLIDDDTARMLVSSADLRKEDNVLEIGPGAGAVTKHLAAACKRVACVEKDERFRPDLEKMPDNVRVLFGDALSLFADLAPGVDAIVANMPFHLCEPVLRRCVPLERLRVLCWIAPLEWMKRMQEHPLLSSCFSFSIVQELPGSAFSPQPRTACCIVRISPSHPLDIAPYVMRQLLLQSDKKLRNALVEGCIACAKEKGDALTKKAAAAFVDALAISVEDADARVHALPLQRLKELKSRLSSVAF